MAVIMKMCTKCKRELTELEFSKNKHHKDGLRSQCKDCVKIYAKSYRKNNRDKLLKYSRNYNEKNRDILRENDRIRYRSNPKIFLERKRKSRMENPEKSRERGRVHYSKNKDYYLSRNEKRKRNYGRIKIMDNPFPEEIKVEWHHINDLLVIPIPCSIHKYNYGNGHRDLMDKEITKLYCVNFNKLFGCMF